MKGHLFISFSLPREQTVKTKDFLGNEWDIGCMGCAISDGSMLPPGGLIQRTKYFCIHQDPLIPLTGFIVVASTRHIQSLSQMEPDEYDELSILIKNTHHAIKTITKIKQLTLVQEESSTHFHLWFFPWTENIITCYGKPSLTKIREIMTNYKAQTIDEQEWKNLKSSITGIKDQLTGA